MRRFSLALVIGCGVLLAFVQGVAMSSLATAAEQRLYIGTYTGGLSRGIYTALFDGTTGQLSQLQLAAELDNPSFLAVHPTQPVLYAVSEVAVGQPPVGCVVAYRMEADGKLTELNRQSSGGAIPCHVAVDREARALFVANYTSGNIISYPLSADGRIGPHKSLIQHAGKSVNPDRQGGPFAHCVVLSPDERFLMAADLGLDQVKVYRVNLQTAELTPNDPPFVKTAPGAGPRHFAFHPSRPLAVVINELDSTMTLFDYDAKAGRLTTRETVPTVPAKDKPPGNSTAEVLIHPQGRWIYGSNRGHNSLVAVELDAKAAKLTPRGNYSTGGEVPRNFVFDPSGRFVLAENQESDSIVVLKLDAETGALTPVGKPLTVGKPVCIRFAR